MMLLLHYVLDEQNNAVAVDTSTTAGLLRWGAFFENRKRRRVAYDVLCGSVSVSTVFLGLDHGFSLSGKAKPVLFETMVFGGRYDEETHRYCTWQEAERGHNAIVSRIRYVEGSRGYSRSHWRKIRRAVLMADVTNLVTNVIPFPARAA